MEDKSVPADFAIAKDNDESIGGNGTVLEVYYEANATDDTKIDVTIVVTNTYYGEVSAVTAAKGDTARSVTVAGMKYETEEFNKDDSVLYTKADGKIQTMVAAEYVTGKVTSINSTKGNFVAGGTTYEWGTKGNSGAIEVKGEYNFYLDGYGYVVYAEVVEEAAPQYAVLLDVRANEWDGDTAHDVKLLLADATTVVVSAKGDNEIEHKGFIVSYNREGRRLHPDQGGRKTERLHHQDRQRPH